MKDEEMTIVFETEEGEKLSFHVLEETRLNGVNYLLALQDGNEEEAYILRERTVDGEETIYDMVEDETELQAIADVFEEVLEDTEIEL